MLQWRKGIGLCGLVLLVMVMYGAGKAGAQPPPVTGGLVFSVSADTGAQKDGSNRVSAWQDQSGQGNDAIQTNANKQPLWVDAALGGKPVVRFVRSRPDWLTAANSSSLNSTRISIFAVVKLNTFPYTGQILLAKDYQYKFLAGDIAEGDTSDTCISARFRAGGLDWGNTSEGVTQLSSSNPYLFEGIYDGGGTKLYVNGGLEANRPCNGNLYPDQGYGLSIGSRFQQWDAMDADVAEVLIYNRALSDEERHSVEVYLSTKYGLPAPPPLNAGMNRRAVLDDTRMDFGAAQHLERIINWLGDNGFARLDGDEIAAWLDEQTHSETGAYGSVAVLPGAYTPATLLTYTEGETPRWLEYINAGGRIVTSAGFPVYSAQTPDASPLPFRDIEFRGIYLLDVLDLDYMEWGRPITLNDEYPASAWGFETIGCSGRGVPRADVTTYFDLYTTSGDLAGTGKWHKNTNPEYPYSGIVCAYNYNPDYNIDNLMEDVYRAALYMGDPLTIPNLNDQIVPVVPDVSIACAASGMSGRLEFVRGENVTTVMTAKSGIGATHIRLDLKWDGDVIYTQTQAVDEPAEIRLFLIRLPIHTALMNWSGQRSTAVRRWEPPPPTSVSGMSGRKTSCSVSGVRTLTIRYAAICSLPI